MPTTTTFAYDEEVTYDDSKRDDFFDMDGDDFIMKFMDSTCQGFLSSSHNNNNEPSTSACLPACNNVLLEQQLEMLTVRLLARWNMYMYISCTHTHPFCLFLLSFSLFCLSFNTQHCRRPLNFLSFFQDPCSQPEDEESSNNNNNNNNNDNIVLLPGVYMTPKDCEYCGAERTQDCNPRTCTRPALYFQKKRPPFCKPESSQWDPINDHAIRRWSRRRRDERRTSGSSSSSSLEEEKKKMTNGDVNSNNNNNNKPDRISSRNYFGSFF